MAFARGLATHPDAARRRAAYEGELAAWATVAVPLAAALNGAKGELGVLNRRRGFADDLEPALRANNVDRGDARRDDRRGRRRRCPTSAATCAPRRGCSATTAGCRGGTCSRRSGSAGDGRVAGRDRRGARRVRRLLARPRRRWRTGRSPSSWVDAEIRDGKQGGAYCVGVDGDVSRVMMNFDGSHDSVSTLAHELGHAFHNVALADAHADAAPAADGARRDRVDLLRDAAVRARAPRRPTDDAERLALLDMHLVGATQVVVDIHSRFLFETELCARRRRTSAVGGRPERPRCSTRRRPPTATACIPTTATSTCGR